MSDTLEKKIRFLWLYRSLVPVMRGILWGVNKIIRGTSHDPTWFRPEDFPWVAEVESYYPAIRQECENVIRDLSKVPNLDDISEGSTKLAQGDDWKGFLLVAFGKPSEKHAARCPKTVEAMRKIPNLNTAAFSVLGPGVHLPKHVGEFSGILRYHMGVIIPPGPDCRIEVDGVSRVWEEGKTLIFDDTHPHEVWNDTDQWRVVLLADFVRPSLWPIMTAVRLMIAMVRNTTYTRDVIRSAEEGTG